jgi:hypothetical protein
MPPVCQVCRHPEAADIALALVAGDSSRSIAKRFETSASAIFRHRRHALKGAAIVRAVEARADHEAESLAQEISRLKADAARLAEKAEAEHDYRGALGAVKLLTDLALRLEELMPTGATEAPILVSFVFPDSGLRTGDPNKTLFENAAASWQREAAPPLVAHEERVSAPADPSSPPPPAAPPPPPMLPPLDLTFRTFDDPDVPRPPSADALARTERWRR